MKENYMSEVAKLLGVELGEEFKTTNSLPFITFRITENGMFDSFGNKSRESLAMILEGKMKIIKLPRNQ